MTILHYLSERRMQCTLGIEATISLAEVMNTISICSKLQKPYISNKYCLPDAFDFSFLSACDQPFNMQIT